MVEGNFAGKVPGMELDLAQFPAFCRVWVFPLSRKAGERERKVGVFVPVVRQNGTTGTLGTGGGARRSYLFTIFAV